MAGSQISADSLENDTAGVASVSGHWNLRRLPESESFMFRVNDISDQKAV